MAAMQVVASQRYVLRLAAHGAHELCEVTFDRLHLVHLRVAVHAAAIRLTASAPSLVRAANPPPVGSAHACSMSLQAGASELTAADKRLGRSQEERLFHADGPLVRCVSALPSVRRAVTNPPSLILRAPARTAEAHSRWGSRTGRACECVRRRCGKAWWTRRTRRGSRRRGRGRRQQTCSARRHCCVTCCIR